MFKKLKQLKNFFQKEAKENEKEVKKFLSNYFIEIKEDRMDERKLKQLLIHYVKVKTKRKKIIVDVYLERPGLLIGKGGETIDNIHKKLGKELGKDVKININEYDPLKFY